MFVWEHYICRKSPENRNRITRSWKSLKWVRILNRSSMCGDVPRDVFFDFWMTYCWWFRNPSPVEVGSLSHDLQGFIFARCCRISSINSRIILCHLGLKCLKWGRQFVAWRVWGTFFFFTFVGTQERNDDASWYETSCGEGCKDAPHCRRRIKELYRANRLTQRKQMWETYMKILVSCDWVWCPPARDRRWLEDRASYSLSADRVITSNQVDSLSYGAPAGYRLLIRLKEHPAVSTYVRTCHGLETAVVSKMSVLLLGSKVDVVCEHLLALCKLVRQYTAHYRLSAAARMYQDLFAADNRSAAKAVTCNWGPKTLQMWRGPLGRSSGFSHFSPFFNWKPWFFGIVQGHFRRVSAEMLSRWGHVSVESAPKYSWGFGKSLAISGKSSLVK